MDKALDSLFQVCLEGWSKTLQESVTRGTEMRTPDVELTTLLRLCLILKAASS